jgi:hypothetical protein
VVLRYTYEVVVVVPEDWGETQINFHRNESSWCADNSINDLQDRNDQHCWCPDMQSIYLREATEEDEEKFQLQQLRRRDGAT